MERKESLLFVYGSLKRGQANHPMLAAATYVENAQTADGYRLLDLGAYPALAVGGNGFIEGELYLMEEAGFDALDAFEGVEYVRSQIVLADGRSVFAYLVAATVGESALPLDVNDWFAKDP